MIGKSLFRILSVFFLFSFLHAEEPFRVFKTPSGKSFEGKVVGYEGQTFILTNKSGQLFQVPFNALSTPDKAYLVEAVKAKRIPKGRPAPKPASSSSDSSITAKGVDFHTQISPILQERCNDCHKAPYEENGRTKVSCPGCKTKYDVTTIIGKEGIDLLKDVPGQQVRCKSCKTVFSLPD